MDDLYPPCQHCIKTGLIKPATRARGLCSACYKNATIRHQYAVKKEVKETKYHPDKPVLPILGTYPSPGQRSKCRHNIWDGECPVCEKEQRIGLTYDEHWHYKVRSEKESTPPQAVRRKGCKRERHLKSGND
jgi:hypothetical protein